MATKNIIEPHTSTILSEWAGFTTYKVPAYGFLKEHGYKVYGDFVDPSATSTGKIFWIGTKANRQEGGIDCGVVVFISDEDQADEKKELLLTKPELREISKAAKETKCKDLRLYTNYGVELHSQEKPKDVGFDEIIKVISPWEYEPFKLGGMFSYNFYRKSMFGHTTIDKPIIEDSIKLLVENKFAKKFDNKDEFDAFAKTQTYVGMHQSQCYQDKEHYKQEKPASLAILRFETGHELVQAWDDKNKVGYIIPTDKLTKFKARGSIKSDTDTQPDYENDAFIDAGGLGSTYNVSFAGEFLGTPHEMSDALKMIKDEQRKSPNYFPTLWYVSDHDDTWPIDMDGNEIKKAGEKIDTATKFRCDVTGTGENTWSSNGKEYDNELEANKALDQLSSNWFGYDLSRVVPVTTPMHEKVDFKKDNIYQNFRKTYAQGGTIANRWLTAALPDIYSYAYSPSKNLIAVTKTENILPDGKLIDDGLGFVLSKKELIGQESVDKMVDMLSGLFGTTKESINQAMELGDNFAHGGRLKSALIRDRKYQSHQEWEKHYHRHTQPEHPHYMKTGGTVDRLGNMDIYGYQTQNFDISPKVTKAFMYAMEQIDQDKEEESAYYHAMQQHLIEFAKHVDMVLSLEKRAVINHEQLTDDDFNQLIDSMSAAAVFNDKSGNHVIIKEALGGHIDNINSCKYERQFRNGGTIESDTPLATEIIADNVANDFIRTKYKEPTETQQAQAKRKIEELSMFLSDKANSLYKTNVWFKKKLNMRGNAGRDNLYRFMHMWCTPWWYAQRHLEKKMALGGGLDMILGDPNMPGGDNFMFDIHSPLFESGGKVAQQQDFRVGDVVYHKGFNTIGIVRLPPERGELQTDADGNVDISELEFYDGTNPKHRAADIAPSTKQELTTRGFDFDSKDKVEARKNWDKMFPGRKKYRMETGGEMQSGAKMKAINNGDYDDMLASAKEYVGDSQWEQLTATEKQEIIDDIRSGRFEGMEFARGGAVVFVDNEKFPLNEQKRLIAMYLTDFSKKDVVIKEFEQYRDSYASDPEKLHFGKPGSYYAQKYQEAIYFVNKKEYVRVNHIGPYQEWQGDVIDIIAERLEATTSDAQGIVHAHEFYMSQSWAKGLSPEDTATLIILKSQ